MGPVVYFFGLQTTAASDASLLANAEMVFTIVIASIAFREKLNRTGLLAVILVSIGVVVVTTNLQFSSSLFDFVSPGHLLILASGLCWGLDNNIITYASERIDVVKFIQFRSSLTGPILLFVSYLSSVFPPDASGLGTNIPHRPARIRRISLLQLPRAKVAGRDQVDTDFPDILSVRTDRRIHYSGRVDWNLSDSLGGRDLCWDLFYDENRKREKGGSLDPPVNICQGAARFEIFERASESALSPSRVFSGDRVRHSRKCPGYSKNSPGLTRTPNSSMRVLHRSTEEICIFTLGNPNGAPSGSTQSTNSELLSMNSRPSAMFCLVIVLVLSSNSFSCPEPVQQSCS